MCSTDACLLYVCSILSLYIFTLTVTVIIQNEKFQITTSYINILLCNDVTVKNHNNRNLYVMNNS